VVLVVTTVVVPHPSNLTRLWYLQDEKQEEAEAGLGDVVGLPDDGFFALLRHHCQ